MEQIMESRRPKVGDIVQANGHGQAMIVADPANYKDSWCADVPNAVICEWMVDGYKRDAVHLAENLEVVGSQPRQSRDEVYEWITAQAVATITTLTGEGSREMALGALRLWSDTTGRHGQDADRLRMQQLIDRVQAT